MSLPGDRTRLSDVFNDDGVRSRDVALAEHPPQRWSRS